MANGQRYGNDYLCLVGKEASYGTEQDEYTATLPYKVEMKRTVAPIDVSLKTGTLEKQGCEMQSGYTGGSVTISGALDTGSSITTSPAIFLEAMFQDSATPFAIPTVGTTPLSYTIYQYFVSDEKMHKAIGCVLESFEITGSSGGAIEFTATFRAQMITYEQTDATVDVPTFSCITHALYGDVEVSAFAGLGHITKINSFTLSLTNVFADDAKVYQNSSTKQLEILTGLEGSLTFDWNYDKTYDSEVSGELVDSVLADTLVLVGSSTWTITTFGKYTDYSFADPDKGIFASNFSKTLMSDGTDKAISIAVS